MRRRCRWRARSQPDSFDLVIDTLAWMLVAATLVSAHRAAAAQMPRLTALLALEAAAVSLVVLAAWSEPSWSLLAQEDGPIEWATFVSFAAAAGYLLLVVRQRSSDRAFRVACWLLAAFCVAVAGEELSWGQRVFGFQPPEVFLDRNFQQEMNLHNVLMHEGGLGFELQSKHLVMAIALGFGVLAPALSRWRRLARLAPLAPPLALAPIALAIVAAEQSYPVDLTGEGAELLCGLLILAGALLSGGAPPTRIAQLLAAPLLLGVVLSAAMARLVFGSDADGQRVARAELQLLQADLVAGAATPRLQRRTIHKRLFTATRDGYLQLAGRSYLEGRGTPAEPPTPSASEPAPRRDRRGYLLDPWNNPYWISANRQTGAIVLYSFGPNRRRDLVVRAPAAASGDDVVVRFQLDRLPDAAEPAAPAGGGDPAVAPTAVPAERSTAAPRDRDEPR
jgi:hypothetical protein